MGAKGDDPVFARAGNLIACAWHDTKLVYFISSLHTNNTTAKDIRAKGHEGGRRTVNKPVIIGVAYNSFMSIYSGARLS